jgi:Zn-dependent protease with chaperone function
MSSPNFPYVSASELENTVKKGYRSEKIRAFIAVALTIGVAKFWFYYFLPNIPYYIGTALFLFVFLVLWAKNDIPTGIHLDKVEPEYLGAYTKQELKNILEEVCYRFGEKEIPNIYIIDTNEGYIGVVKVDILKFVRRWNAVYISKHILHSFNDDELRAILGHEICHIRIYYTFWQRFFYLRPIIFSIWFTVILSFPIEWLWNYTKGGSNFWIIFVTLIIFGFSNINWIAAILIALFVSYLTSSYTFWLIFILLTFGLVKFGWFIAWIVIGIIAQLMIRNDDQEIEALCDLQTSRRYGLLPIVNGLLKLGTRIEIFSSLVAQFSPNEKRPVQWLIGEDVADNADEANSETNTDGDVEANSETNTDGDVEANSETNTASETINAGEATIENDATSEVESKSEDMEEDGEPDCDEVKKMKKQHQLDAMKIAYDKLLEILPTGFISLENSQPYIEEAIQEGLNATRAKRYKHRFRKRLHWLKYDTNVVDQQLDRVEYAQFIHDLEENPEKPLFYIPEEFDPEQANVATHPPFRNRILFLEYQRNAPIQGQGRKHQRNVPIQGQGGKH